MATHLEATSDDMDVLHRANNEARDGTKVVRVERQSLARVLRDHARLLSLYERENGLVAVVQAGRVC